MKIGMAGTGAANFDNDFAWTGSWFGKINQLWFCFPIN
jgi:hypothetical protein